MDELSRYLGALAVLLRAALGLVGFSLRHPGTAAAIDPRTGRVDHP